MVILPILGHQYHVPLQRYGESLRKNIIACKISQTY